jgi:3-oxoacyl-[acyl-carrier protein] reductase
MNDQRPVALVTGGGRGMGLASAVRLASDCSGVAVLDKDAEAVKRAQAKLETLVPMSLALTVDVTDAAAVESAVREASAVLGPPTVLVNAAGILRPTRFLDISEKEWDEVLDVSVKGTFLCARACLPGMIEREWGRIVNFSSTAGKSVSTVGGVHYTAAKAALLGLTRGLAKEVAPHGICVNAVCPGLIDTEMVRTYCSPEMLEQFQLSFPISRLGHPAEVAALVGFLCSRDAAYITGAAFDINGGDLMV